MILLLCLDQTFPILAEHLKQHAHRQDWVVLLFLTCPGKHETSHALQGPDIAVSCGCSGFTLVNTKTPQSLVELGSAVLVVAVALPR